MGGTAQIRARVATATVVYAARPKAIVVVAMRTERTLNRCAIATRNRTEANSTVSDRRVTQAAPSRRAPRWALSAPDDAHAGASRPRRPVTKDARRGR